MARLFVEAFAMLMCLGGAACQRESAAYLHSCRRVASESVIASGTPDGPNTFFGVSGISAGTSAVLYLADPFADEIMAIDPDGNVQWRAGRSGSGPGEFLDPWNITLLGDTIVVFDGGNHRLSLWNTSGDHIGVTLLDEFELPGAPAWLTVIGPDRLIATTFPVFRPSSDSIVLHGAVVVADRTGTIDTLKSVKTNLSLSPNTGGTVQAFRPSIMYSSRLAGGLVGYVNDASLYRISLLDQTGRPVHIIQVTAPQPTTGAQHRRMYLQYRRASDNEQVRFPAQLPSLRQIQATADGLLLVQTYWWTERGLARWDRWTAEGDFVDSFLLPARLRYVSVGGHDLVYGVTETELGVQNINVYRITDRAVQCPGPFIPDPAHDG
jgi:hypothetical protein